MNSTLDSKNSPPGTTGPCTVRSSTPCKNTRFPCRLKTAAPSRKARWKAASRVSNFVFLSAKGRFVEKASLPLGTDDLIIVASDETRVVGGLLRRGVAYLIFGGTHLTNQTYSLNEVGSTLPGVIFVGAYEVGSADDAPVNWAGAAGDVNADGFDDILIGAEMADFVNPLVPTQRRIDAGECYLIYGNNSGSNVVWSTGSQTPF